MIPPLVSVIIPAFNREATIARCIDSVLTQTHEPIEVIIVDDGSTDQTVKVVQTYGERVTLICQPNGGPSSARNTGAARAKGEIISFLDSDDTWKPDKLARQVMLMVKGGKRVPCCICNADIISPDGSSKTSFDISQVDSELDEGYWINPALVIATRFLLFNQVVSVRRDVFDSIGGFNESMRLLEDHDLAFRLALKGPWGFIKDVLVEKYNDSDGIGVVAMQDPCIHLSAWLNALNGFLEQPMIQGSDLKHRININLKDGSKELLAIKMIANGGRTAGIIGELIRVFLRIKRGVYRRLPSWPRAQIVSDLSLTAKHCDVSTTIRHS